MHLFRSSTLYGWLLGVWRWYEYRLPTAVRCFSLACPVVLYVCAVHVARILGILCPKSSFLFHRPVFVPELLCLPHHFSSCFLFIIKFRDVFEFLFFSKNFQFAFSDFCLWVSCIKSGERVSVLCVASRSKYPMVDDVLAGTERVGMPHLDVFPADFFSISLTSSSGCAREFVLGASSAFCSEREREREIRVCCTDILVFHLQSGAVASLAQCLGDQLTQALSSSHSAPVLPQCVFAFVREELGGRKSTWHTRVAGQAECWTSACTNLVYPPGAAAVCARLECVICATLSLSLLRKHDGFSFAYSRDRTQSALPFVFLARLRASFLETSVFGWFLPVVPWGVH